MDNDGKKKGSFTQSASSNQARLRVYTLRARNSDSAVHDAQIADLDTGRSVIRLVSLDMNAPNRDDCHSVRLAMKHLNLERCSAQESKGRQGSCEAQDSGPWGHGGGVDNFFYFANKP